MSKTADVEHLIMLLYRTGKELWRATGTNTVVGLRSRNEMKTPKIDDLVIEISMFGLAKAKACETCKAVGYLKSHDDSDYIIERLDNGEKIRWINAEFVKLPILTT